MKFLYTALVALILASCGGDNSEEIPEELFEEARKKANYNPIIIESKGLKLTEVINFPPFSDVSTELESTNQKFKMGENKIEFKTTYFNLGERTVDENDHKVRLRDEGQYLGIVRNGKPTTRVMGSIIPADLDNGVNYFLCFLSRSYDISVKNPNASFLFKIEAEPSGCVSSTGLSDTAYAVLQPSGSYVGVNADKILLDFYLKNVELSNGNYAVVTIDNVQFKLGKWAPFWIEGLKMGDHIVTIQLYTKDGKKIPSVLPDAMMSKFTLKQLDIFEE